jgi:hypothetical protein
MRLKKNENGKNEKREKKTNHFGIEKVRKCSKARETE